MHAVISVRRDHADRGYVLEIEREEVKRKEVMVSPPADPDRSGTRWSTHLLLVDMNL